MNPKIPLIRHHESFISRIIAPEIESINGEKEIRGYAGNTRCITNLLHEVIAENANTGLSLC
jgi:hypothetical protein